MILGSPMMAERYFWRATQSGCSSFKIALICLLRLNLPCRVSTLKLAVATGMGA